MRKISVNPKSGFCTDEVKKDIIRVTWSAGKMMNEPVLPHFTADGIVRDNFYSASQGNSVSVMFIAKPGFVVCLEIFHFHGVGTCRHPDFIETFGTYFRHLHRTGITVGINGSNRYVFALGK